MKALFVVDMQEEYVGLGNRYGYDSSTLIREVNGRIQQAVENREIVVYIGNRKRLKSGIQTPEFAKELLILSNYFFFKERASLFSNDELLLFLKKSEISEAEFIGVDGNCCVASSALEGVKLGLSVSIPCRCVGVKNPERFSKKKLALTKAGVLIVE